MTNRDVSTAENLREQQIVVLSAGTSQPSTTLKLASDIAAALSNEIAAQSGAASTEVIEIAQYARALATAVVGGFVEGELEQALQRVRDADVVVVGTPVYKAAPSGLFKMFIDVLPDDAMLGTPVILSATAGTPRHALVIDGELRSLFAYLRAAVVPTSVFAATEDWERPRALQRRIERAAAEASVFIETGVRDRMRAHTGYRRTMSLAAADNDDELRRADDLHIDTDLLSAITGGSLPPR